LGNTWEAISSTQAGTPVGQFRAIAETLRTTLDDAPSELKSHLETIADSADAYADAIAEAELPSSRDFRETAEAIANVDAPDADPAFREADFQIWAACPDLDAFLGGEVTMIGDSLLAVGGSEADMESELLDCMTDRYARQRGDNEGCDDLADACDDGVYDACDDLHFWTQPGSEYQEWGTSCGERRQPDDELYGAGWCDDLAG
jgi:hypothetical protein